MTQRFPDRSEILGAPLAIAPQAIGLAQSLADAIATKSIDDLKASQTTRAFPDAARRTGGGSVIRKAQSGMDFIQVGKVAVLPLLGFIFDQPNFLTMRGIGTSASQFAATHAELVADESVNAILWDIDSPGGTVAGTPEAADSLLALRGKKRTVAVSNKFAASAAYWLASTADELIVSPSSMTGSIGVISARLDVTRALDMAGVAVHVFSAGAKKAYGMSEAKLTPQEIESTQARINSYYDMFVSAVSRSRRMSQRAVRETEADIYTADLAVKAGLADRVETFDSVLSRLMAGHSSRSGGSSRAAASYAEPVASGGMSLALAQLRQRQARAM